MLIRTHLAVALALAAAGAPLHGLLPGTAGAVLGAWLPDIDLHLSPRGPTANPFAGTPWRHRTATHSFLCLAALTVGAFELARPVPPTALLFFALGFLSHVALDACTRSPVFPFWPFMLPLHLPPLFHLRGVRTGGAGDRALGWTIAIPATVAWIHRAYLLLSAFHNIR